MLTPVADDRIAVLESRLLPGRASTIDWAFFLGSSLGTLELQRALMVVRAGRAWRARAGRKSGAPGWDGQAG